MSSLTLAHLGSSDGGGGEGGTRGVPASCRPVIANYCSQACGFGFRDCKLRVTQAAPPARRGRGFSVTLLHYYRIIILGGELLILLVTARQCSPSLRPLEMRRRTERVGTC